MTRRSSTHTHTHTQTHARTQTETCTNLKSDYELLLNTAHAHAHTHTRTHTVSVAPLLTFQTDTEELPAQIQTGGFILARIRVALVDVLLAARSRVAGDTVTAE